MTDRLLRAIFVVAIAVRLALAAVNLAANDKHMPVIRVMALEHRIPDRMEIGEAFQPKLFHGTVAVVWMLFPAAGEDTITRVAQFLNVLVGAGTLWLVLAFVRSRTWADAVKVALFALVALNPKLIGINAQATNDTFVIGFVTAALFFGHRFFTRGGRQSFAMMLGAAILACLSKGSGLVVVIAILMILGVIVLRPSAGAAIGGRRAALGYAAAVLLFFLAIVPWAGPYWHHWKEYGSPLVINVPKPEPPRFLEKTPGPRPGVRSVVEAYLTFPFVDLLQGPTAYAPRQNRYSLWTQLYGRAHSVHFDAHPPSWRSPFWQIRYLLDVIFVLALVPTVALAAGVIRAGWMAVRWLVRPGDRAPLGDALLGLCVFGYLGFIVLYTWQYRDYATMKAIFIYPGLLGMALLLGGMGERIYGWVSTRPVLRFGIGAAIAGLLGGYLIEVGILVGQLSVL